ncbi:hypothetical protein MPC4_10237 [Methylocella tundrae]|uniref:Uncharacterized protein n=1 Tax=Methylocella tundrae TaxID=227605 RepID=A0A8B6LZT6_METTU|nr:hypothetical protein MPC1_4300004 [Methylocella tundrae]VTZ48287.1 hypothetical protein MPC4_10237 [Methylocella tundrae]
MAAISRRIRSRTETSPTRDNAEFHTLEVKLSYRSYMQPPHVELTRSGCAGRASFLTGGLNDQVASVGVCVAGFRRGLGDARDRVVTGLGLAWSWRLSPNRTCVRHNFGERGL